MKNTLLRALCALLLPAVVLAAFSCKTEVEEPPTYTVTFDYNDGSETVETVTTSTGYARPRNEPYREGYWFNGWYLEPECITRFQ